MKKTLKIILIIALIFLVVWGISMLKCEYLTARYGHEFDLEEPYKQNSLIPKTQSFKVMSYGKELAELYCIGDNYSMGNLLIFKKADGKWTYYKLGECVWTALGGNADNDVWPYFWHNTKYARAYTTEINHDKSFFIDFRVEDEKVYIECDLTIESKMDYDVYIEGHLPLYEGKLLKERSICAYDKETGSDRFKLVHGTNKFTVVFVGDYGGTHQKINNLLPDITIYPYTK